jgi:hypothetical protein
VRAIGDTMEITPYDVAPPSGTSCISSIRALPRSVPLRWPEPGPSLVRLRGRDANGRVTVDRLVVVIL